MILYETFMRSFSYIYWVSATERLDTQTTGLNRDSDMRHHTASNVSTICALPSLMLQWSCVCTSLKKLFFAIKQDDN